MLKITTIITSFNAVQYIERAINSFLIQNHKEKELIIMDGKSKDGTHKIISKYQKKYPELIKWIKEDDRNIHHARNIAVKYATGDVVGFLGADDVLHKDFYENFAYEVEVCPEFDVAYFNNYIIDIASKTASFNLGSAKTMDKRNLVKDPPLCSGEAFYYKRYIFDKFSFNEENKYYGDYEFNLAIVSNREQKYLCRPMNITSNFNIADGTNMSIQFSKQQRIGNIAAQLKFADSFSDYKRIFLKRWKFIIKNQKAIRKEFKVITSEAATK